MKSTIRLPLELTAPQEAILDALQERFAAACNALAPRVAEQRCWNRVTLHHLSYRDLRVTFPELGSQMACNAIYAVCRASRLVYQHPKSPFNVTRLGSKPLPRLQFTAQSPVYFDRHTLSLRGGEVSLFTPDGRIHCPVRLPPATQERLRTAKLREVLLARKSRQFVLEFKLAAESDGNSPTIDQPDSHAWPPHVKVMTAQDSARSTP